MILAPIVRGRKGEYKKDLEKLARQGFVRARIDGVLRQLDEEIALDRRKNHTIEVVVDRLLIKPEIEKRLEASIDDGDETGRWAGARRGGERRGAAVFAEAGLSGLRRQRSATGAAVVFLQQPVRRVRNLHGLGQHVELRSGEGDRGPVASRCSMAGSGRAAAPLHDARAERRRRSGCKIDLTEAVREAAEEGAERRCSKARADCREF